MLCTGKKNVYDEMWVEMLMSGTSDTHVLLKALSLRNFWEYKLKFRMNFMFKNKMIYGL